MSFFEEEIGQIENRPAREARRREINRIIGDEIKKSYSGIKQRAERARAKALEAREELKRAEAAVKILEKAMACSHDFVPVDDGLAGTTMERCTKCDWTHYC